MDVRVVQGSLTDGSETLWVNASNTNLQLGSGVSGAIRRALGARFQRSLDELLEKRGGPLDPGDVVVTDAGGHALARYVAHVAVMDYRSGGFGPAVPDLRRIEVGCDRLWAAIEALTENVSVAMVALGAGTGGLGVFDSIDVACRTLRARAPKRISQITFYGFAPQEYLAMAAAVCRHFPEVQNTLTAEARAFVVQSQA